MDPGGWTAGLRRYVDTRYRLVASGSFEAALRSAVTSMRRTSLPVAITVAHGNHAWLLTGFNATADPTTTGRFTVTSVRVVGPLWGLQSRSYGYDMRPDTKLTPAQLKTFFTPWHYAGVRMAWEGDWVSIQPIGSSSLPAPAPTTMPRSTRTPAPTARPTPTPGAPASPSMGAPLASTVQPPTAPTDQVAANPAVAVDAAHRMGGPPIVSSTNTVGSSSPGWGIVAIAAIGALVAALVTGLAIAARVRRRPTRR